MQLMLFILHAYKICNFRVTMVHPHCVVSLSDSILDYKFQRCAVLYIDIFFVKEFEKIVQKMN